MKPGLNRVTIKTLTGNKAKFSMEVNPMSCRFLAKIPDIINPKLNIDNWPKTIISNGKVTATIALPDPKRAYYRGPRFDHSSIIPELKFNNHSYFGLYAGKVRNPVGNSDCAGPSEEFFEPLGYDRVKVGQPFIKVGVGLFERAFPKYFFGNSYWPVKFFEWKTKVGNNFVEFSQEVVEGDYSYDYTRKIIIPKDKNTLVIKYFFKNTGKKRIITSQYAHNFIKIDNKPINSEYTVRFKNKVKPVRPLPDNVKFSKGNTFNMYEKTMFTPLLGFKSIKDNCVDIFLPNKTGIKISGDFIPFRYWLFSCNKTVCPESFIRIDLAPGQKLRWTRTYAFY